MALLGGVGLQEAQDVLGHVTDHLVHDWEKTNITVSQAFFERLTLNPCFDNVTRRRCHSPETSSGFWPVRRSGVTFHRFGLRGKGPFFLGQSLKKPKKSKRSFFAKNAFSVPMQGFFHFGSKFNFIKCKKI